MALKQLNTTIILRNDTANNWKALENSPILSKGEVAIEFDTANNKTKLKIGDGVKTWEELPYFGGEEAKTFQVNSLEEITDTELAVGDTAIVKTAILVDAENEANSKYSYTGYVWNGTAWAAMDGNYNAKNVYFDSDLVMTQTFGKYAVSSSTPNVSIDAAGMSIYDLLMDAYSEKKNPTKTEPKVSAFNVTGNGNSATTFEVGTSVTPQWTSTFNSGSYTYKSSASNVTITPVSGTGVTATSWESKALKRCVTPRLIVRWEKSQIKAGQEVIV